VAHTHDVDVNSTLSLTSLVSSG